MNDAMIRTEMRILPSDGAPVRKHTYHFVVMTLPLLLLLLVLRFLKQLLRVLELVLPGPELFDPGGGRVQFLLGLDDVRASLEELGRQPGRQRIEQIGLRFGEQSFEFRPEFLDLTSKFFRAPLQPGRGTAAAREAVRARIPPLDGDRYLKDDLDAARGLVADGAVLAAAESAVGPLE